MIDEDAGDATIDRLLRSLAAQAAGSGTMMIAPAALAELAPLSRAQARLFAESAGRVTRSSTTDAQPVKALVRLIVEAQRSHERADAGIQWSDDGELFEQEPDGIVYTDPATAVTHVHTPVDYRLVDRLIRALAAQVASCEPPVLTPAAAATVADMSRGEARLIYGTVGHSVHYDSDESMRVLIRIISDAHRVAAPADAALRPGDAIKLIGERLSDPAEVGQACLDEIVYVIRYVPDDGTVDVQPDLIWDYIVETVPASALMPAR